MIIKQFKTVLFVVVVYLIVAILFDINHSKAVDNHLHIPDGHGIIYKLDNLKGRKVWL